MDNRKIIHLDMDAFFAAIEERDNPSLSGKPVIVGSLPDSRGVVSTCNYIARGFGIHSAMSSAEAYRRCPHAIFIKPNFKKYIEASTIVHSIMSKYTDKIEFVSLDEGYMDVSGSELLFGSAESIAKKLRQEVFEAVKTTCSIGVGYCMLAAKCASEEKKPNGFFVIKTPEEFRNLTNDRGVGELHGVGAKTAQKLINMGIKTIGQLANCSPERLKVFGISGEEMRRHALGIDNREVISDALQKSIGRETTFLKDTFDKTLLKDTLVLLSDDISYRLYSSGLWARTITLKIKFEDLKSITRSRSGEYVRTKDDIYKISADILNSVNLEKPVRLIGISASNLTGSAFFQLSFANNSKKTSDILNDTVFNIKKEFGRNSLKTAKEMEVESKTDFHL